MNSRKKRSFNVNNSQSVNECEANIQTESVGQGRFASRLYSHLQKEDEGGNDNLDECIESDCDAPKSGGPLTNRQLTEIPVDIVYIDTHTV